MRRDKQMDPLRRGEPLGHTPALGCPRGRSIVTISADGPKAGKPGALEGQWEFRGSDSPASCQLHSAPLSTCCQAAVAELRSGRRQDSEEVGRAEWEVSPCSVLLSLLLGLGQGRSLSPRGNSHYWFFFFFLGKIHGLSS